ADGEGRDHRVGTLGVGAPCLRRGSELLLGGFGDGAGRSEAGHGGGGCDPGNEFAHELASPLWLRGAAGVTACHVPAVSSVGNTAPNAHWVACPRCLAERRCPQPSVLKPLCEPARIQWHS